MQEECACLCAVDVRKTENVVIVKSYVIPQNAVQHIRHDDGCGRFGLLFDVANIHHHALCVKTANGAVKAPASAFLKSPYENFTIFNKIREKDFCRFYYVNKPV